MLWRKEEKKNMLCDRAFYLSAINARGKSCEYLDPDTRNFSLAHLSPRGKKHDHTACFFFLPFATTYLASPAPLTWFDCFKVFQREVLLAARAQFDSAYRPCFIPPALSPILRAVLREED